MASNCPKCHYFLVRCRCAEILLEVENKKLKDELEDYWNAEKFVLGDDCPTDEVHCGCVVILKKRIKELETGLRNIIDESKSKAYSPKIVKSYAEQILKEG